MSSVYAQKLLHVHKLQYDIWQSTWSRFRFVLPGPLLPSTALGRKKKER